MGSWIKSCAGVALLVAFCPALAVAAPPLSAEQARIVAEMEAILAKMDETQRGAILTRLRQKPVQSTEAGAQGSPARAQKAGPQSAMISTVARGRISENVNSGKSNPNIFGNCPGLIPLLRQDWKDIALLDCPQSVKQATGAQIAVTDDRVKNNVTWSTHGTAALVYNIPGTGQQYWSTGAYATFDRATNSSLAQSDSNSNSLAYGGFLQTGFANPGDTYFASYLRVRGGGVQDYVRNTTAANVTLEWMPVYENYERIHIHSPFVPIPGVPLIIRVDPVLLVQYVAQTAGAKPLAFNDMSQALRIGPQLTLNFYPGTSYFSRFHGSVTYHWAYEAYSGRQLDWFQSSLTYNLDDDGYIGLTGTYQRGHDEDTGVFKDVYTVGLTGKI
jgi:hypothetical protein